MASLDTKMTFTLKDLIMMGGFLVSGLTAFFSVTGDISEMKKEQVVAATERAELKEANKAYASLPKDMQQLKLDMKANAKITQAMYLGLIDKDIIDPPR